MCVCHGGVAVGVAVAMVVGVAVGVAVAVAVGVAVGKDGVMSSCAVICSYLTDMGSRPLPYTRRSVVTSPVGLPLFDSRLLLKFYNNI